MRPIGPVKRSVRRIATPIVPDELRRRLVARFPRLPLAPATFEEAGRRGDAAFFEAFYSTPDPYSAVTKEVAKYGVLLDACGPGPFDSALEIGCSVGVFTAMLAPRCNRLLAVDIAENALKQGRLRTERLPQVRFERRRLPAEMPDGSFDLVVASDVLYYWSKPDLERFVKQLGGILAPSGRFVSLSWLGPVRAVGDGAEVSAFLRSELGMRHVEGRRVGESVLDVFEND